MIKSASGADEAEQFRKELAALRHELNSTQLLLASAQAEVTRLTSIDALTGIWNRQRFSEAFRLEAEQSKRYKQPLSLLLVDIDFFKRVIDSHGYEAGDKVLLEMAKLIQRNIRGADLLARWGGEEFVILTPCTEGNDAYQMAEKLRKLIREHYFAGVGFISVSIGVTDFLASDTMDTMVHRADEALCQAKSAGRNATMSIFSRN